MEVKKFPGIGQQTIRASIINPRASQKRTTQAPLKIKMSSVNAIPEPQAYFRTGAECILTTSPVTLVLLFSSVGFSNTTLQLTHTPTD